jgi:uncharacterized protein (DUF427 family)
MQRTSTESECPYPGRSSGYELTKKKSAEVIVFYGNEPMERLEDSQIKEGLNIKRF